MSLRAAQQAIVFKMLNLNEEIETTDNNETIWKVLIYDKMGQDIISPLIKVGDLRERGVTVHMSFLSYLGDYMEIVSLSQMFLLFTLLRLMRIISKGSL